MSYSKMDGNLIPLSSKPLLHYPDLTVGDIQNSNLLNHQEKEVVFASLNNPKIRTLDLSKDSVAYNALISIVIRTIWESGISTITEDELKVLIPIIVQEINIEHKDLTIEDVSIAFKYGVRRKYNDYFGINIATVSVWLQKYSNETKREAMKRLSFVKKEEKPKEITEEERKKLQEEWLKSVYDNFNKFKATGVYDFNDYKNGFYKYCKQLQLINLSEDEQQEIWDMAIAELKREYQLKSTGSYALKKTIKSILDNLEKGELGKEEDAQIVIRAKKIVVKQLFQNLIKDGMDLREFIDNAKRKKKL